MSRSAVSLTLALLLAMTLRAARDLLALWHEGTAASSRIALLEASALMSQAQAMVRPPPVHADFGRDVIAARQRIIDVLERGNVTIAMQPIIDLERDRWVAVVERVDVRDVGDPRHRQQVVDQPRQPLRLLDDEPRVLALIAGLV